MTPEIVGRDDSLARLSRFVEDITSRPESLVIVGEAGIGKTTLWQATVDAAAQRGYCVLLSGPVASEVGLAYSGLADLLTGVDRRHFLALPEPQRHALEIALLQREPDGRPPDARAIFTAFGGVVSALAKDAPVLVAVDDLHWLDASSRRALDYVARRLVDEHAGVLAAARFDADRETDFSGHATLRLPPLGPGALHTLIKRSLGVSLTRPLALRVHRSTGGNPFFALALTEVLVTAGLPGASDPWPVPDDVQELVMARLGQLTDDVAAALLVASVSARPTIAGLDASALQAAADAGIVTLGEDGRVRFSHPLFASAVYGSVTPEQRRRVHARLAEEESGLEEQARHRALAAEGEDEDVAELLERAAASASARGAPDVAAELAERSATLTPADRPQLAWQRRAAAAEQHSVAGDLERARAVLLELVDGPADRWSRSHALRLLGEVCYRVGSVDEALSYLAQAVDAAEGNPAAVARAELERGFVVFSSFGSWEEAAAAMRRAAAAAETVGDRALLSSATAAAVIADLLLGNGLDEATLARALALEDPSQSMPVERRALFLAGVAMLQVDELERARVLLTSLRAHLVEQGAESDLPEVLALLARLECVAGNLVEAGALADRGYELALQARSDSLAASTRAIRALVHAHEGREAESRAAASEAIELAARSGWRVGAFWASVALGLLELSLGNDAAVVDTLQHSLELVESDGVIEPSRRPFLADAIEALVRLGDLERAERLTGMFEECAAAAERSAAILAAARCRALVLAARGELTGAVERLDLALAANRQPQPLELARTLMIKGQLERRRKQRRAAKTSLTAALRLCEQMGAVLWADRARTELARLGHMEDPDELTATELQVARLSASGLTNREVAASLFLSQKTVEANLTRIYRKLGIRSRAELGAWLAGRERVPG